MAIRNDRHRTVSISDLEVLESKSDLTTEELLEIANALGPLLVVVKAAKEWKTASKEGPSARAEWSRATVEGRSAQWVALETVRRIDARIVQHGKELDEALELVCP